MPATAIPADSLAAIKKIDGWLSDREAGLLWSCARDATGPIIEIGSHEGRSTAALGLGSLAGNKAPVYAIDSFIGSNPANHPTAHGKRPGWKTTTPERLRSNLDAAGVNGLVNIIAKTSQDAVLEVPQQCSVLFVDGGHEAEEVGQDLWNYLPFIQRGGLVILHDFHSADPGVMSAAHEYILSRPQEWQMVRRCDTCLVARKQETTRRTVMLAIPSSKIEYSVVKAIMQATFGGHEVVIEQSGHGWDDMNELWVRGINAALAQEITHFAMLHSDVAAGAGWLDCLLAEMDDWGDDMISTIIPIKDARGLTSCGIGDQRDPWLSFRRFTMREIMEMPETFGIENTDYFDRKHHYLLHNTGCWAADLRTSAWYTTEGPNNELIATLQFPIRARRLASGRFGKDRESEDWYFSRRMADLGLTTSVTRKVELWHIGAVGHPNFMAWGEWEIDIESASKWSQPCPRP